MDPFSGTAGAMTALGLASKLIVGGKQIHDFWTSIEDAPDDSKLVANKIRLLTMIFEGINENHDTDAVRLSLAQCEHQAKMLNDIVSDLEPYFHSSKFRVRKWASLKAVFRKDQISKIQASISTTKSSLHLALQTCYM